MAGVARSFGVRGATHQYAGPLVLQDVDCELRSGVVHAIVATAWPGPANDESRARGVQPTAVGHTYRMRGSITA
jgi:hypothetical protein